MSEFLRTVRAVERLLRYGEAGTSELSALTAGDALGLWRPSEDGSRKVLTQTATALLAGLPAEEGIAAIFACEPAIRPHWLHIAAARLRELGQRRDTEGLCAAIETLSGAGGALLEALPEANLNPTPHTELERSVLDAPADQAVATPRLLRVLGATAELIEGKRGIPAAALPDIHPLNPAQNWVQGRILRLPDPFSEELYLPEKTSVLSGSWQVPPSNYQRPEEREERKAMRWVLQCPWPFLLAQVVFTQEAWAAERNPSGMALELDRQHEGHEYQPPQVRIAVTTKDGEEVECGSLGALTLRVLGQLGVALLAPALNGADLAAHLDERFARVINALLLRKVWRFTHGGTQQAGVYSIHPEFSDECYRALGSSNFYRQGDRVTVAIRTTSENWATERLSQRGSRLELPTAGGNR
jgi:hypothetical protein